VRRWLAVPIALVLLLPACSAEPVPPATTQPVEAMAARSPVPTPPARPSQPEPVAEPIRTLVVVSRLPAFRIYERPRPEPVLIQKIRRVNDWHQTLALPVIDRRTDATGERWFEVRLPTRPNGSTGWLMADHTSSRRLSDRIVVDLSAHTLTRWHRHRVVARYGVGVGLPQTPTTPGRFFVWARVPFDAMGPYGVFALGLSGFSEVITEWVGGGRMAIHGTPNRSDPGSDISHGCVRVYNDDMLELRDVAMGTPVTIRP
jgi:hypothetical protein